MQNPGGKCPLCSLRTPKTILYITLPPNFGSARKTIGPNINDAEQMQVKNLLNILIEVRTHTFRVTGRLLFNQSATIPRLHDRAGEWGNRMRWWPHSIAVSMVIGNLISFNYISPSQYVGLLPVALITVLLIKVLLIKVFLIKVLSIIQRSRAAFRLFCTLFW